MESEHQPGPADDLVKKSDKEAAPVAAGPGRALNPFEDEQLPEPVSVENPQLAKQKSNAVTESAAALGAEMMVTACPLCRYNLEKNGSEIPVVYFTELLAEALGVKEDTNE